MSYILSALKKSEQERRRAGAEASDRERALKWRLSGEAEPPTRARRSPRWRWIAAAVVAIAAPAAVLALIGGEPGPSATAEVVAAANQPSAGEPTAAPPAPGAPAAALSPPRPEAAVAAPPRPAPVEPLVAAAPPLEPPPPETTVAPGTAPPRVARDSAPASEPAVLSSTPRARPPRVTPAPPNASRRIAAAPALRRPAAREAAPPAARDPRVEPGKQLDVELAALPPPAADADAGRSAALFNDRAWEYERDGLYDNAVETFTRAINLRPDYAEAYFGRGWVNERLGHLERAVADYSWAIKVRPRFAAAYTNRGILQLYRNRLDEAERDFAAALAAGDDEARRYAMLWRYVAVARAGGDGRTRLAADARSADLGRWPGVLARFFLGEASAEQVLAEADDRDPLLKREKICVATFFLGQHHLLRGDPARAEAFFRDTVATGVSAFVQYAAAERELERIARLR